MYYSYPQIVLQEVPGEISLALSISGCNLNCKGCHSSETFRKDFGKILDKQEIIKLIKNNKYITCILFYGGEWLLNELKVLIGIIKEYNIKVALYTGNELTYFDTNFLSMLDYIKTGPYIESLGALGTKHSNQKFYILR